MNLENCSIPELPDLSHVVVTGRWISWVPPAKDSPDFDAAVACVPEEVAALQLLVKLAPAFAAVAEAAFGKTGREIEAALEELSRLLPSEEQA